MSRTDYSSSDSVICFLQKLHLPIGQVKNRIHKPDSKIY